MLLSSGVDKRVKGIFHFMRDEQAGWLCALVRVLTVNLCCDQKGCC